MKTTSRLLFWETGEWLHHRRKEFLLRVGQCDVIYRDWSLRSVGPGDPGGGRLSGGRSSCWTWETAPGWFSSCASERHEQLGVSTFKGQRGGRARKVPSSSRNSAKREGTLKLQRDILEMWLGHRGGLPGDPGEKGLKTGPELWRSYWHTVSGWGLNGIHIGDLETLPRGKEERR